MPSKLQWVLRIVDLLDIIALVVLSVISIKAYHERETYIVSGLYLVAEGLTSTVCDAEEAYQFSL